MGGAKARVPGAVLWGRAATLQPGGDPWAIQLGVPSCLEVG